MTVPTLPTPPSRSMSQDTFDASIDAWIAALQNWTIVVNAMGITTLTGSIQSTPIGNVTPSTGAFTTLTASGQVTVGATANYSLTANGTTARYIGLMAATDTYAGQLTVQAGGGSMGYGGGLNLYGHSHATRPGWVTAGISATAGSGATEGRFTVDDSAIGEGANLFTVLRTGNVGIGTTAPDKALEINSATGSNLRLTYNDSNGGAVNYADFSVSSSGDLTIAPSGGDLAVTGALSATGAISGTTGTFSKAHSATPSLQPRVQIKNATAGTEFTGRYQFVDGNGNEGWEMAANATMGSGYLEFNEGATNRGCFLPGGQLTLANGLAVTGALSATGATNLDAGTVAAPGLYLEGETGTGLYRIGANNHGYAVSGAKVLDIASTGLAVTGALSATTGLTVVGNNPLASVAGSLHFDYSAGYGKFFVRGPDATTLPGFALYLTESDGGGLLTPIAINNSGLVTLGYGLAVTGRVDPSAHNTYDLGTTGVRWKDLWLQSGAFNGSDARLKTAIAPLSANEINAAKQLSKEIGTYQWLESVQKKGDAARHHVGCTVQRAIEILQLNNCDPFAYGFIGYDKWEDEFIEHAEILSVAAKDSVLDELDNILEPAVEAVEGKAAWTEHKVIAGDAFSFRYDQLNMFIAAGLEARLAALEAA